MREIKFRAWDKTNKRFVTDSNLCIAMTGEILGWLANEGEYDILQYTNHTDADGREVYEGDILGSIYHWSNKKKSVAWAEAYSGWQWCLLDEDGDVDDFYGGLGGNDEMVIESLRVIGNIYENPELLQRQE